MKSLIILNLALLLSGCALAQPPSTKFTVQVTDAETGTPITNAWVRTGFKERADPWGAGVGKSTRVQKQVDSDGVALFKGNTISEERGGRVFADGYYSHGFGMKYSYNIALNRWEPWNPTFEVKMRPKKNPVPMYHREGHWSAFKVPEYEKLLGYDLEKQDFVSPHGKGSKADLFFEFKRDFKNSQNYDVSCRLTFPNEHDGIQEYYFDEAIQSSFKWPYLAPTNNYQPTVEWHSTRSNAGAISNNFKENVNYIFRVRTQVDDEGNITSACYGKISGPFGLGWADWVNWVYWFNPVPNERSLEYNGVNLLKK
ncbi:hypothetical protein EGM51_04510 [Verrucomicrobia bacterium S94]|nr:hypothetical protein EGM51_04510 [Verrucomicrobia bacterium S94]